MKKIILVLFLTLSFLNTEAQTDTSATLRRALFSKGKVSFGLKAGYTQSNLYGSDIDYIFAETSTRPFPSFHVGLVVNTMSGTHFWIKHELLLLQKGAGVVLSDSINGRYPSTLKMLSLDLFPLSPCFHFKGLQLYAGPYMSVLLNSDLSRKNSEGKRYNDHSIFGDASQFEENSKYLQKMDFGINAGLEYQFPFGFLVGFKYMQGFVDMFQYANSYTLNDSKRDIRIYNRAFLFSVGYSFMRK